MSLPTTSSSAGVGRTGTFIALDITLDQMKAEKTVDIKGTMEKMREKRMHMIQTVVGVRLSCMRLYNAYIIVSSALSDHYV